MAANVTLRRIVILTLIHSLFSVITAAAEPGRWEQELSGEGWKLWLDREAEWLDDELFLPSVDVSNIPENPPTCGWDNLDSMDGKTVSVPGTVEEHYWGANGNPVGIAGDYRGVSWWSTKFKLGPALKGKKIIIAFESVNLRAEVYVNRKLAGYDVVANTPFEADITDAVIYHGDNRLDIRITDPVGNFSWPAHITFPWGRYNIPAVRGFGGITGKVTVRTVDAVYIDDIYVQNKPEIKEAEVFVSLGNSSGSAVKGTLSLVVREWKNQSNILWEKTVTESIPPEGREIAFYVRAPKAKPWGIHDSHLYTAFVTFTSSDGAIKDSTERRFGFRWFDIGEKDGDQRLYLNGRRVFIKGCKNRTFWPTNGTYASPEWAKKDVELVIEMGYNAIKVTNAIAQPGHIRCCDELGVLYTGRSSGYRINFGPERKPLDNPFTRELRRENLLRFIRRDRSCPSLYFYSLKGEDSNPPDEHDFRNMEKVRELDPTRILVYNGGRDRTKPRPYINDPLSPAKSFYKPLDPRRYTHGWWDMHHWGHAGYRDDYYRNPNNYLRLNIVDGDSTYHVLKDEIIYYGEEGSFGSMVRLGKIKEQLDRQGSADGWREREHLDWYKSYDTFLNESGFRTSFPTVDNLTKALGANLFYFHGRILENCRISNIIDAYIINGAASGATHTDMFDVYRNPTGDTAILSYYARPLYVAVKIRDKVMPVGTTPVADIFIVNELDLRGRHTLELELEDPAGNIVFAKKYPVTIKGGEEYGQLLAEGVKMPPVTNHGHYKLNARIAGKMSVECRGFDSIFAVDYTTGRRLSDRGAVVDTSGVINALLKETRGLAYPEYTADSPRAERPSNYPHLDYIIIGAHDFENVRRNLYRPIMEQVLNGATLVVLDNAEEWAEQWDDVYWYQAIQYTGSVRLGNRGRLFVGKSRLLDGLPVSQSMSWEYQVFYSGNVRGLNMGRIGNETVVALAAEHKRDILTAVARIPCGRGQIIVSTLDMMPNLGSKKPQTAVAKRLFLNFLECSEL